MTRIRETESRSILSPTTGFIAEAGFTHSLTPARNCTFGCTYCYVPTMGIYGGLKPQDWKRWGQFTTIKRNAPELLRRALRPSQIIYCSPLVDPYQPAEAQALAMPPILEAVLRAPPKVFTIQTRGPLILRDVPLLRKLAAVTCLRVSFSVTTNREDVRKLYEPLCASIPERFATIDALRAAGIETWATLAPILPCDPEVLLNAALAHTEQPIVAEPLHTRATKSHGATTREAALQVSAHHGFEEWHEPDFQQEVVRRMKAVAALAGRALGTGTEAFRWLAILLALAICLPAQVTLRQEAAQRLLLFGAAADADEFGAPNRLNEPAYAATLGTQFNMLEAENAMKWNPIHPSLNAYNFSPGDKLVAFAMAHGMAVRGHNLCWHAFNPAWVTTFAATASTAAMSALLHDHIMSVAGHYRGQIFAWDVVNEAISDSATGKGTDLRNSVWYNQPGIGLPGTGYVEQAFRWAHEAAPEALLFYNEYSVEGPGAKFNAMYNMVADFVARGVPIHGVGLQMHIDTSGYPDSAGLAQNIQRLTALGLQVHITEMDVKLKVDSGGVALAADLEAQAQTYARILAVCLKNPGCTAFQTWGLTDKYSWIPGTYSGFGAALPFDLSYQPKPAVGAMIDAMQTVPPSLSAANVVNAASYRAGAVAPGELLTIFGANYGPADLSGAQPPSGTQVLFDGKPAPVVYARAGQVSVVTPYEVSDRQQTAVQYQYMGVVSNTVSIPVAPSAPGVFSADSSGSGPGAILNQDLSVNSVSNPAKAGSVVQIFATGGGTVAGGAVTGAVAQGPGRQTLPVTVTIGGTDARVAYAGPAPGELNGVMQVNAMIPAGLPAGPQVVIVTAGGVGSQAGVTVAVQ